MTHVAFEFDCCECGRHIVDVMGLVRNPPLCAECLFCPGWFNDPEIARIFDPSNHRNPPPHET